MAIPNMFQPALNKISSIASTAKHGIITRVLSFTGSFNDHTRLLNDAELGPAQAPEEEQPAPPSSQAQEAAPASLTAAVHTIDIEAVATAAGEAQEPVAAQDAETKRVAKSVQTVCLFAASASLVLFVNLPTSRDDDDVSSKPTAGAAAMYDADLVFISLGFFSSLGLSMFSIVARSGETVVVRVQKWGMVVAVASVLVAFTLRMCMMAVAS